MKCLFSIVFVFKLSICVVALSSFVLEIAVFTCSTVSFRSSKELSKFLLATTEIPKCERAILALRLSTCIE